MLKPTATTVRSPQRARKKKKTPFPRLTEAPVQSQAAKPPGEEGGTGSTEGSEEFWDSPSGEPLATERTTHRVRSSRAGTPDDLPIFL
jgi:hypothetical protein